MEDVKPDKLYKYCPWNDYTKDIIVNNRLYFSSANNFNDPFDANLIIDMDGTPEEWIKKYVELYNHYVGEISKSEYDEMCFILYSFTPEQRKKYKEGVIEQITKTVREETGIYCFTKSKDNILMWSHYADNHKGICLEFNHSDSKLLLTKKVNYYNDYPRINYFTSNYDELMTIRYFTKAKDWEYEAEYRIVIPHFSKQQKKFEPKIITGVICGCCMPDDDIEELRSILKMRTTPITLYKAKKKEYEFGLDIELIEQFDGTELSRGRGC